MSVKAAEGEMTALEAQLGQQESESSLAFLSDLRSGFGMSREKLGRLTGFSIRALASWESGTQKPGEQARLRLIEMARLLTALSKVVRRSAIPQWLDTPNSAFDGLKPLEVVERGQVDRLWRMIFYLESGVAS